MKIKLLKAGNGDSILISFQDDEGVNRNILIDGGISETYSDDNIGIDGELKTEIDNIKTLNDKIDLLILTHIDNDHICGLLNWIEKDKEAHILIDNVWFNSGKLIAEYLKKPENGDLNVFFNDSSTTYTGVKEGILFEKYLDENKKWDKRIIIQGMKCKKYGIQINVLSPNRSQLKKLLTEYKAKTGDNIYTSGKVTDWDIDLQTYIQEERIESLKFKQDNSCKNGSSISFILTIKGKNFLFLGDSHPNEIVKYLKKNGHSKQNPLSVELLKISHHGSKANTSNELLELIKTNIYAISTDSSTSGHPNKRTLARIININPNAIFHFNYEYVQEKVFSKKDYSDFKNFKSKVSSDIYFEV